MQTQPRWRCAPVILCVLIACAACTNRPIPTPPVRVAGSATATATSMSGSSQQELLRRWLMKYPCAAPCWEGITPGVTSPTEAMRLLQANPLVSEIETSEYTPNWPAISFIWNGLPNRGEGGGITWDARSSDPKVYTIGLFAQGGVASLTLDEVIAAYGQPTHMVATRAYAHGNPSEPFYGLTIGFLHSGFALTYAEGSSVKPPLSLETRFRDITLFRPNSVERFADLFDLGYYKGQSTMTPWQGTRSFDEYCRQVFVGEPCK